MLALSFRCRRLMRDLGPVNQTVPEFCSAALRAKRSGKATGLHARAGENAAACRAISAAELVRIPINSLHLGDLVGSTAEAPLNASNP